MTIKLETCGDVKRSYDDVCKKYYDDGFSIDLFIQNGGDADFTITTDGDNCNEEIQFKFVLGENHIDALIEELQKAKAQRADWADRNKSR